MEEAGSEAGITALSRVRDERTLTVTADGNEGSYGILKFDKNQVSCLEMEVSWLKERQVNILASTTPPFP